MGTSRFFTTPLRTIGGEILEHAAEQTVKMQMKRNGGELLGIYDSHKVRAGFEDVYGKGNVQSSTVLGDKSPGIQYAGGSHPKTQIVYDTKGFAIFDDIAKFDTRIPESAIQIQKRDSYEGRYAPAS